MENLLISLLPRQQYSVAVRYSATLFIVAVATLLRLSLADELQHYPVLLFIPAVFLSSLLFDRGSGFFATVVSTLIAIYLFIGPANSFQIDIRDIVPLMIFVGIGFAISAVTEALRKAIQKLSRMEAQKSLLLEELGHRTKNDLFLVSSVLTLQAKSHSDPNVKSALQAAVARVSVIARAQARLRGDRDGGAVEIAGYLEDLCRTLGDMLRDVRPIAVVVNSEKVEVSASNAVSIGLIVNELVTNAFKYAFPEEKGGTIKVSLYRTGASLRLEVEDDGVGCPPEPSQGLGSRLVRLLAAQLQGTLERDTKHAGCKTVVSLPIQQAK